MKMTYVPFIQGNMKGMKTIYTTRATSRIIDGSYNSIYKGRSMNFDELREYVAGDDIKDVDWNATARSQKVLVRQYIAEKKHNIMLVLDTNRRMLANANETQEKKNVALMAAGSRQTRVVGRSRSGKAPPPTRETSGRRLTRQAGPRARLSRAASERAARARSLGSRQMSRRVGISRRARSGSQ